MSVAGSRPPHPPSAPRAARRSLPLARGDRQSAAACAGLPPEVVFATKAGRAAPALRACAGCAVRRECEAVVAPEDNWFDGVCGGRLWRSGRPVALGGHVA
ncbi:WhiB family transcriptional regulator [Streptomyces sp. NPDC053367]|uniref:WhiB family transcriptional regulator n=1 Tax=Streptomyces sp. NPDC053367 TaxID=3365700 RepID=UPI0037CD9CD6